MSWPCADESQRNGKDALGTRCQVCGHVWCMPNGPCETCATNRRIDQLIGDDK